MEDINANCPYLIRNLSLNISVPRRNTYNMDVLGYSCSNTSFPRTQDVIQTKQKFQNDLLNSKKFVRIIAGESGVKLLGKLNEEEVRHLKQKESNNYPSINPSETKPCRISNIQKTILVQQPCLTLDRGPTNIKCEPQTIPLSNNNRCKNTVTVTSRASSCSIGINTEKCLLDDLIEERVKIDRFKSGKFRDVAVQSEDGMELSNEIEDILNIINIDEINKQIEKDQNLEQEFKKQLFHDLQTCLNFSPYGNLPLHDAVIDNNVKLVIRYCTAMRIRNVEIDVPNQNNQTALQLAIISKSDIAILEILIKKFQADIDVRDSNGNSILHLAILHLDAILAELLMGMITKPNLWNSTNFDGLTPLILAVMNGDLEKVEALLKSGVDPNAGDQKSGRAPLFHAVENNNLAMVDLLLDYNAQTKNKNFFGTSPHDAMFELDFLDTNIKQKILHHKNRRTKCRRKRFDASNISFLSPVVKQQKLKFEES